MKFALLATVVVALFAVIGAGVGGAYVYTSDPKFCGETCHWMTTRYSTWKHSTHSEVSCLECHAGPGLRGEIEAHLNGARYIGPALTGRLTKPIIKAEVKDISCLQCHEKIKQVAKEREIPGTLIEREFVHSIATRSELSCTHCHENLVHRSFRLRELLPSQETCIKCHQERGVISPLVRGIV